MQKNWKWQILFEMMEQIQVFNVTLINDSAMIFLVWKWLKVCRLHNFRFSEATDLRVFGATRFNCSELCNRIKIFLKVISVQ